MKRIHIIAILLGTLLLISSACASPAPTTPTAAPAPTQTPVAPAPTLTVVAPTAAVAPAQTTPAPAPTTPKATPAPAQTTPAPAPTTPKAAPAPVRGAFAVSELKTDVESITLGENVTISVMVKNTGRERGTYTLAVKFNGDTIATKDVTLDGGSSEKVNLTVIPETIGEYKVTVDDQTIPRFEVLACPV